MNTEPVWPKMPNATFMALGRYVSDLARDYGLTDWEISFKTAPCGGDAQADITCTYGQRRATIALAHDFATYEPQRQRRVLIHELTHCHLDPIDTVTHNLERILGVAAYGVHYEAINDAVEWAADIIATAIAPKFALPEVPDATDT